MNLVQGTDDDGVSSASMIASYCKNINLSDALQKLGIISKQLVENREQSVRIEGVLVSQSFIAYISMCLIENASDDNSNRLTEHDIATHSSMWQNLPVPTSTAHEVEGTLVRLALSEFYVQRSWRALLPRTLVIYDRIWQETPIASKLKIHDAIAAETGLTIKEIIMFGAFYADKVDRGVLVEILPESEPTDLTSAFIAKQGKFFRWTEYSYEDFRAQCRIAKSDADERFRFNPLMMRPLVIPDQPANGVPATGRLVPSTPCLGLAVPEQIYHRLYERHQDKNNPKKNEFRTAFGYAFEEYVHTLLTKSSRPGMLLREEVYDNHRSLKTSDITRINEGNAVCIEVKLSGIRLNTYLSGDLDEIRLDIARNVVKAVSQLITLRVNMIDDSKYASLAVLRQCHGFEHLVVLYDNPPRSNSLIKRLALEQLRIECINVPENFHWHVIGIDDLEDLLGIDRIDLFEFLKAKRRRPETDLMDFGEYIHRIRPDLTELSNPFLDSVGSELLKEFKEMLQVDKANRSK